MSRGPDLPRIGAHVGLALATVLVITPQLGSGLMLWDHGEVVFFAQQILDFAVPGLDYTVNAYGPGRYLLMAALFGTFGASLTAMWVVFLLLRIGITACAFELGRAVLPARARALAWVAPIALILLPGPLHKGFYVLGALALALGLVRWLEHPTPRRALGFGALLACVATFRMDLGAFGAVIFFIAAWPVPKRSGQIVLVWGSLLLTVAAFAAAILAMGGVEAVSAVADQIVDDVAKNNRIRHPVMPGLGTLLGGAGLGDWLMWSPLPVYVGLFAVLGLSPSGRRSKLGVVLLFGIATCNQIRMKPEFGHLLQTLPLVFVAWSLVSARLLEAQRGPGRTVVALVFASLLPALVLGATLQDHRGSVYTGSFTIPEARTEVLETEMGSVRLNQGEHLQLERILRWLKRAPPGPLWVPTNQPLLYGLSGREDVTGHVGLIYYADDRAREDRYLARLEANPPPVAVYIDDTIEGPGRRLRAAAPKVHTYLMENYRTVRTVGDTEMMIRNGP